MLKRINWKAVLFVFTWLVCLAGLVTLMSFIGMKESGLKCKDIKIIIPGTSSFIDREEVNRMILGHVGALVGKPLYSINIHQIENLLKKNHYIRLANLYTDMDGTINLKISQREPVLRIMNLTSQDFYVDMDGFKIPSSAIYTPRVPVANGYIMEGFSGKVDTLKTRIAKDLYKTALYIEKDTLWSEQIEQIYVNEQNEIELIPRVGNHRILLGTADSLEVRLNNLKIFYKRAIPVVGWDAYKTINIKYSNQIVCEKNIVDSNKAAPPPVLAASSDSLENIQNKLKKSTP